MAIWRVERTFQADEAEALLIRGKNDQEASLSRGPQKERGLKS